MSQPTTPAPRHAKGIRLTVSERYYERGLAHFTKDRLDLALADLDEAIAHDPKNAELYVARGLILLEHGWDAEAETDFSHGLKLDPTQWLAHYGRAIRVFRAGRYQDAIDLFSRAQHLAPERWEIYYHRAVAFYEAANLQQALLDMEFAASLLSEDKKRLPQAQRWLEILRAAQTPSPR